MPIYEVECWVECRTVYAIEADSEEHARELAMSGEADLGDELITEVGGVESTGEVKRVAD